MHWIIQKNYNGVFEDVVKVLDENNLKYSTIDIVPFSEDVPDLKVEDEVVVYGTTTLMINASKKWSPGIFFDEENFKLTLR